MATTAKKAVGNHVCVVGAGMLGLLALKNLKEQGLKVTSFERNDYIGGTWHFSMRPDQTSALELTTFNGSKQSVSRGATARMGEQQSDRRQCALTDFPFSEGKYSQGICFETPES